MQLQPMSLSQARHLGGRLLKRFDPSGHGLVVGSTRRGTEVVKGDIELLLPAVPEDCDVDLVYEKMRPFVYIRGEDESLFAGRSEQQHFDVVQGFKPGFASCRLHCPTHKLKAWECLSFPPFNVEIYRFRQAAPSNFGWRCVQYTGPRDFNLGIVQWVKRRCGGVFTDEGLLIGGHLRHLPTEESFFAAIGLEWIPPEDRTGGLRFEQVRLAMTG